MSKKIIFIDIDGTLVTSILGKQYIPESAKRSIQETRKKGNLVYLCTGRSLAEIGEIKDIGFDGMIGGAGCYIENHGQVLEHFTFDIKQVTAIKEFLDKNHIYYFLECNDGIYCHQNLIDLMINEFFHGDDSASFIQLLKPVEECDFHTINKISFISTTLSYDDIEKQLKENYAIVKASWGPGFEQAGEISLKGVNKAVAMHKLLDHLNISDVKTYAFGDSMNDKEMFENVDVAIAMGNCQHGIEQYATFVTKDLLDDGIEYAMKKYHLIES